MYLSEEQETVLAILSADLVSVPCMFVLTSHHLFCFEPLNSTNVHAWDGGSQIVFFQNVPQDRCIKITVAGKPNDEASVTDFHINYSSAELARAAIFVNTGNLLCMGHCWGAPDKICDAMQKGIEGMCGLI